MRLIDADVLKRRDILDKLREAEFDDEIEAVIDSIPTAYDIEAKVEELEEEKHCVALDATTLFWYQDALDTAIDVIRRPLLALPKDKEEERE